MFSTPKQKIRNHKFNERSYSVFQHKRRRNVYTLLRPLAFSLILVQSGCRRWLAEWGNEAIAFGLLALFVVGFWNLAGMAREILADYRALRKTGKVSMENLLENVKPDFLMMGFVLVAMGVPTAAFLSWDTIQGLIAELVSTGLRVP